MRALIVMVWIALSSPQPMIADSVIDSLQGLNDPDYVYVESDIVGRGFHIIVREPGVETNAEERYPVVYTLDGGMSFPLLAGYLGYLEVEGRLPPIILVGISYRSNNFEQGNMRSTDFTAPSEERSFWGGAEAFQSVLREEIIPAIEQSYPADPEKRVLIGNSLGGQFVVNTAFNAPDLFWAHIAVNPALHRNLDYYVGLPDPETGNSEALLVYGGELDAPRFRLPLAEWLLHAESRDWPWRFEFTELPGETHLSALPLAFRRGLEELFPTLTEPED